MAEQTEMTLDNHIHESKKLHKESKDYGLAQAYKLPTSYKSTFRITEAIESVNRDKLIIDSVLDYGAGKGGLVSLLTESLNSAIKVQGYDPCVAQFEKKPNQKFKLITCIDVLEHIERNQIAQTLNIIKSLNQGLFFYIIDLIPARKSLSDGRNAHIMLAPPEWWSQQLTSIFPFSINFQLGKLPDGSNFPLRFIGCSANETYYLDIATTFLKATLLCNQQWTLENDGNSIRRHMLHKRSD